MRASEPRSLFTDGCPECGYDVPPVVSRADGGAMIGWTCQRCGWHPRFEPVVLPEAHVDLSDERLRRACCV